MTVDPVAGLRTVLLADAGVSVLVSTRVFGGEIPAGAETKAMPRPCVVLNPSGGPGLIGQGDGDYGDGRIDAFCYGSTLNESWMVYLAVHTALKHLTRKRADTGGGVNVLLHWAQPLSKGALGRDPVTQWPLTLSSWRVLASEIAA